MDIAALIFDCDGTLVNNASLHCRAWARALADVGADMRESWYHARVGLPALELLRQFREEHGVDFDTAAVMQAAAEYYLKDLGRVQVVERIARIARSADVPVAVASGGPRVIVEATLRAAGLRDLFSVVVAIEDVEDGKPAPDLFLEAARRLGVPPGECLVYEDSDEGVAAARSASMSVVDVRER